MKTILILMVITAVDFGISKMCLDFWETEPFEAWRVFAFCVFCALVLFNSAILSLVDDRRKRMG